MVSIFSEKPNELKRVPSFTEIIRGYEEGFEETFKVALKGALKGLSTGL